MLVSDLEFIDVAILKKIGPETTVEGFGSNISSTFFEAANLLGALKLKGYIDIHSAIGNSPVIISEKGRMLLNELDENAEKDLAKADLAILSNIRDGVKDPVQIESNLNLNSADVAYGLYKLWKKGLINYKVRNAKVELSLTAQGFEHEPVAQSAEPTSSRAVVDKQEINTEAEVKNKIAEELAKEEFIIGDESAEITAEKRIAANVSYYANKYKWLILLAIIISVLIGAVAMAYILKVI